MYTVRCINNGQLKWTESTPNIVVNEGLEYVMGRSFGSHDEIQWHCGLLTEGYGEPEDTMQEHPTWIEFMGLTTKMRPHCEWVQYEDKITYISTDNQFMVRVPGQVSGAFMTSERDSNTTKGTLYGVSPFVEKRQVVSGDSLLVTIQLGAKA
jgi:hypothetical protein